MKTNTQSLRGVLEKSSCVESVSEVKIKANLIERVSFTNESLGKLVFHSLKKEDAPALFDFYFNGLSQAARDLYLPYPLFSPPVSTAEELALRIEDWKKEKDWTLLILTKGSQIIGVCHLKRWGTGHPVSGLAVHEVFRNAGLGFLMQSIVCEQARLQQLKEVWVTVAPDNIASLRTHKKCGFKETGRTVPHYGYQNNEKTLVRYDIELVKEIVPG